MSLLSYRNTACCNGSDWRSFERGVITVTHAIASVFIVGFIVVAQDVVKYYSARAMLQDISDTSLFAASFHQRALIEDPTLITDLLDISDEAVPIYEPYYPDEEAEVSSAAHASYGQDGAEYSARVDIIDGVLDGDDGDNYNEDNNDNPFEYNPELETPMPANHERVAIGEFCYSSANGATDPDCSDSGPLTYDAPAEVVRLTARGLAQVGLSQVDFLYPSSYQIASNFGANANDLTIEADLRTSFLTNSLLGLPRLKVRSKLLRNNLAMLILLDTSGSMCDGVDETGVYRPGGVDVTGTLKYFGLWASSNTPEHRTDGVIPDCPKFSGAKAAIDAVAKSLGDNDLLGVVRFNRYADTGLGGAQGPDPIIPLGAVDNLDTTLDLIGQLLPMNHVRYLSSYTGHPNTGLTNIDWGYRAAINEFNRNIDLIDEREAKKVCVVISDGEPSTSTGLNGAAEPYGSELHYLRAIQRADYLAETLGVRCHVIGLGPEVPPALIPVDQNPVYEGLRNAGYLKKYLSRRLAATCLPDDPAFPSSFTETDGSTVNLLSCAQAMQVGGSKSYLQSPEPEHMAQFLKQIFVEETLRLVNPD